MLRLAQTDRKWGNTLIGNSKISKISSHGCLITALCCIWSKFYHTPKDKNMLRPDEIATRWTFVAVKDDPDPKYLLWSSVDDGMKFIWRNFGYAPTKLMEDPVTHLVATEREILKDYMNSENYGVVFQVKTKSGGQHWCAGVSYGVLGVVANECTEDDETQV